MKDHSQTLHSINIECHVQLEMKVILLPLVKLWVKLADEDTNSEQFTEFQVWPQNSHGNWLVKLAPRQNRQCDMMTLQYKESNHDTLTIAKPTPANVKTSKIRNPWHKYIINSSLTFEKRADVPNGNWTQAGKLAEGEFKKEEWQSNE